MPVPFLKQNLKNLNLIFSNRPEASFNQFSNEKKENPFPSRLVRNSKKSAAIRISYSFPVSRHQAVLRLARFNEVHLAGGGQRNEFKLLLPFFIKRFLSLFHSGTILAYLADKDV